MPLFFHLEYLLYTLRKPSGAFSVAVRHFHFPTISCVWSSIFSTLISARSALLWSPHSVLIALIYFSCFNTLFYPHSDLLLSLCAALIDPLRSNMLALLLSDLFFSIFLHSTSIVSDHLSTLCMLHYIRSVFSLIPSDYSTLNCFLISYRLIVDKFGSAHSVQLCLSLFWTF